jgi:prepilin-type N-terminal cleavage/methylation domain-containing protein
MRRQQGFTILEMLVTIVIFLMVVPAIISSMSITQKTTNSVNKETLVRQRLRNQMDRMVLEIRKARAFLSPINLNISQITGITDEVAGLSYPNGVSDATALPFISLPARGSALAFMAYERTATVGTRTADVYRLVCYYLKRPVSGQSDYDQSNSDALSLRRFESSSAYVDSTGFGATESTAATSAGLIPWAPPGPSAAVVLPNGTINGRTTLLTSAIAPGGSWVRGKKVPEPGGFFVVRDGGSITIHMIGYVAKQTFYLQSQTVARNYL